MDRVLDFAVIGAQKAGTTSAFAHLSEHPEVFMPAGIDLPFFSRDEVYGAGWKAYRAEHFAAAPRHAKWGTATPQYMLDERVPERMRELMPDIALVALLRNPIERALSHYRMSVRKGWDRRSFPEAVSELCRAQAAARARALGEARDDESACYLVWGEYGRILGRYLEEFPREQLLIVFTDEMEADVRGSLRRIFAFLGVDPAFVPRNVERRAHVGGVQDLVNRFPALGRAGPLWSLWRALPAGLQARIRAGLAEATRPQLDPETRRRLIAFYREDVERLQGIAGGCVPWREFSAD